MTLHFSIIGKSIEVSHYFYLYKNEFLWIESVNQ